MRNETKPLCGTLIVSCCLPFKLWFTNSAIVHDLIVSHKSRTRACRSDSLRVKNYFKWKLATSTKWLRMIFGSHKKLYDVKVLAITLNV
jgi:hypothetical protein